MGLFKELALLPLAPLRGTLWITEQVAEEAERRLYDEDSIKRELIQLEFEHDAGKISDEERQQMELDLLERLAIGRQRAAEAEYDDFDLNDDVLDEYEVVEDG